MTAYYNENDPFAAAWLRELIKTGHIAYGEVDERSIEDVRPSDLAGFAQCHFFAGIGGWSRALRLAGVPDDYPIWTGSCPCQSFSAAGQGKGFSDQRHLWPSWFHLISQCQPTTIIGEQVDAAIRHGWLDLVQTDLETFGYAFGSAVVPAAGIGAPHGRHRLWFVAQSEGQQQYRSNAARHRGSESADYGSISDMADSVPTRWPERGAGQVAGGGSLSSLELSRVSNENERKAGGQQSVHQVGDGQSCTMEHSESEQARLSRFARERRKTAGFWADADWIPCRDDKWRPIEPGFFPLAHGVPARMDKLRGFGNAIVPQVAQAFIEASMMGAA